jgi:hypothetical protein
MTRRTTALILLGTATLLAGGCAFVGGVFGSRGSYKESSNSVVAPVAKKIEVREYAARVAAEVTIEPSEARSPENAAFRALFDYISGKNEGERKIAMTTPVQADRKPAKIAMTVPVEARSKAAKDSSYTMKFFLPSEYTVESAPVPSDPRIRIVEVPAVKMAVYRFAGAPSEKDIAKAKEKLLAAVETSEWEAEGEALAYFYDPPFTLPPFRRNEVLVPVRPRQ